MSVRAQTELALAVKEGRKQGSKEARKQGRKEGRKQGSKEARQGGWVEPLLRSKDPHLAAAETKYCNVKEHNNVFETQGASLTRPKQLLFFQSGLLK